MGVSEPQRTSTAPSIGISSSIPTEVNLSGPHLPLYRPESIEEEEEEKSVPENAD